MSVSKMWFILTELALKQVRKAITDSHDFSTTRTIIASPLMNGTFLIALKGSLYSLRTIKLFLIAQRNPFANDLTHLIIASI